MEHDLRLALYEARRYKTPVRCFLDVLALDDLNPRSTLFELQAQLWSVAEETARVVAEHRARTTKLEAKPKPKSARLRRLVERLLEARAQLILELTRRRVPGKTTTLTLLRGDPPALRYTASPGLKGERRVDVSIQLSANDTGSAGHLFSRGSSPPEALVEALDAALGVLLDPDHALTQEVARVLDRPTWQVVLEALDAAPALQAPAPPREERLYWALNVGVAQGLTVELLRQVRGQRGDWLKAKRASWEELDAATVPPEDARVLHALAMHDAQLHWSGRSGGRAQLMRALVGHPRVLGLAGEPVSVELRRAGLAVRERRGRVSVQLAVDGQVLPERDPLRSRILHDTEPVIAAVEPERLSVIEVPPALRAALTQLSKVDAFPPEAKDALLTRLSRVGQVVPLDLHEMPDRRVPARAGLIAQLEARGDGLELRFLVRPLPGGGSFAPGDGPPAVLGTDESGRLVVAERDRGAERATLQALAERLSVTLDLSAPELHLAEVEAALETLERLRAEPNVELEWRTKPWQLRRALPLAKLELQVADRRDWFGLAGGIELDGQRVQLALLLDAARRRSRYVKLADGEWAPFEDSLRRFLARLEGSSVTRRDELELTALALPALRQAKQEGVKLETAPSFSKFWARAEAAERLKPRPPRALARTLRGYQKEGHAWLSRLAAAGFGCVLADDMGLGKTLQMIAALIDRAKEGPALVVAPTSVVFNWLRELERFAPSLDVVHYHGSSRALPRLGKGQVVVTSYGVVLQDEERLARHRFTTLVLDEAQAIKNPGAKRAKAVGRLQAEWRVALTGTPIENRLGELWAIFHVVAPGLLGGQDQFHRRFVAPIESARDQERAKELAALVRPFVLRRTKAEVAPDLPPRTEVQLEVDLSGPERKIYEDARLSAIAHLTDLELSRPDEHARIQILSELTRLRLIACHARLVEPRFKGDSAKLESLFALLETIRESGQQVLVFSQFTKLLDLVRERLDEAGAVYAHLDGSSSPKRRREAVDSFQSGQAPVFLVSTKAGGFGLNLTAASYVVHLDPWWNPAVEDQATDRAHRIGQDKPVTVYRLVARGTIESAILELHGKKRSLAEQILSGADSAARMDSKSLMALIRGSVSKVSDS